MKSQKTFRRRGFRASEMMKKIMAEYFYDLDRASKSSDEKVAWCSSVGPAELLLSMGYHVYFPENHAAMLGATRMATELIPFSNAIGYSPEICSYLTSDIGAYKQKITPLSRAYPGIEGVPRPDVLMFNTNQCRDVQDWFAWYGREFDVPVIGVNTPVGIHDVTETHVTSIAKQMEELIDPLEKISGNPYDRNEFMNIVGLSKECSDLWKSVLDTAAVRPSPITFYDCTIQMGPAVVLRGTHEAVDYYQVLLKEIQERVAAGEGAVEGERIRLYWEGMPIWGRLRDHSEFFGSKGVSIVASTYCNSWIFSSFSASDPFASTARAYTELFIARSDDFKEQYIRNMTEIFDIDGIIFHDSKTCHNNTNSHYGMPQRLEETSGIPSIVVNGDLNDLRCLSDEQMKTNFEAFIEQLEER